MIMQPQPSRASRRSLITADQALIGIAALTAAAAIVVVLAEFAVEGPVGAQIGRVATFLLLIGIDASAALATTRAYHRRRMHRY